MTKPAWVVCDDDDDIEAEDKGVKHELDAKSQSAAKEQKQTGRIEPKVRNRVKQSAEDKS